MEHFLKGSALLRHGHINSNEKSIKLKYSPLLLTKYVSLMEIFQISIYACYGDMP